MKTFTIDAEDNITAFASTAEAGQHAGVERFHSAEQLAALAERWPVSRLAGIWNKLPGGVQPVRKFTDRQTGLARIWKALQGSQPAAVASKPQGGKQAASKQAQRHTGHRDTKATQVIALLKQPSGASLKSFMKATGWQSHSVRGFVSGHLHKKLGLRVKSFKREGERVYAIRA